ncbi:MAG: hypothetical protein Q7R88_01890 [bacterium]|nr:hypothetical protein [bacterium]
MQRIIADILMLVSLLLLPAWVTVCAAVVLFFYFQNYYEILLVGLLLDLFYALPVEPLFGFQYVYSIIGVVLFIGLSVIKDRLRTA